MAGKIFISYRRDDDASAAARVSDRLASKFGKANLFIDVDNLLAGQRFDEELAKTLEACDVLIAVIGQRWMDLLKAKITSDERDYVREEIAAALQRRIVVVPARVGREGQLPRLPRAEDLPANIRDLVLYQKQDVTHERFGRDIGELIKAITVVRSNRPIKVDAAIIHGAPDGWFIPGNGKAEWFKDHEAGPDMVVVPAGKFRMGSSKYDERPKHKVTIARPFAVGRFAVTFDEWTAYVRGGLNHNPGDEGWGRGRRPVINVSWEDAKATPRNRRIGSRRDDRRGFPTRAALHIMGS
jgi:formylglycine-generating enzyme required for sulfatase activity